SSGLAPSGGGTVTSILAASGGGTVTAPTGVFKTGTTVTVTTAATHRYLAGQQVAIAGVGVAGYNGTFTIASVPTPTTFTYTAADASILSNSGGGTVTGAFIT